MLSEKTLSINSIFKFNLGNILLNTHYSATGGLF